MLDLEVNLKLVCDAKADLGEGPVWDTVRDCLYWVDILNNKPHIHDLTLLAEIEATLSDNRFNDGKCDPVVIN